MAIVIINGQEVELGDHERLNGIQAAARAGVEIPHYCWHAGLSVVASCRMCLVESGTRDPQSGKVTMQPKLVPACQTPAKHGTVFVTDSEKVTSARAMVEEDLLLRHPIDCPICDKAGECSLQDYHFLHGREERRADIRPFTSRRRTLGDTVTLFVDRCVMCTRCVRFCREITGSSELMVTDRGAHEEIDAFPGFPLANKLSGNVVDLCPVGALGDRDFLYQQRVWFMKPHDGVCSGCSAGCSIRIEENQDRLYRLQPRENPYVNKWWMCDEGRYGWKHVHDVRRITSPLRRIGPEEARVEWSELPEELERVLQAAGRLAVVVSPFQTVEEAYLLAQYARRLDPQAPLVLGPVPVVGEDESFPGGFTIRAEKCPNRRGVEAILSHFGGPAMTWSEFLNQLPNSEFRAVWVAAGYPADWADESVAERLAGLGELIVQDLFPSPLADRATVLLPAAAFAERAGSYVNCADRLQSFTWAIRPPAGVMSEGQLCWRLLGRKGLYQAASVLGEIARECSYFSAAAGTIPATGLDLKVNQLATART